MKDKLIKHIEAYVSARQSGNDLLIAYAIAALETILEEVFPNAENSSIV